VRWEGRGGCEVLITKTALIKGGGDDEGEKWEVRLGCELITYGIREKMGRGGEMDCACVFGCLRVVGWMVCTVLDIIAGVSLW
jgi:hypothetical protein